MLTYKETFGPMTRARHAFIARAADADTAILEITATHERYLLATAKRDIIAEYELETQIWRLYAAELGDSQNWQIINRETFNVTIGTLFIPEFITGPRIAAAVKVLS